MKPSTLRIYLVGPMRGLIDNNVPAFAAAAGRLRDRGYQVISPAELNAGRLAEGPAACLRRNIRALLDCDSMLLLYGWEGSDEARLEWRIAAALKLTHLPPNFGATGS